MQKRHKVHRMLCCLSIVALTIALFSMVMHSSEYPETQHSTPATEEPRDTPQIDDVPLIDSALAAEIEAEAIEMAQRYEEARSTMDLIMRIVVAEAGNQGYDGMRAVAQVIYDRRYNSPYHFGDTIEEIIYAKGQFCAPYSGDITPWYPDVLLACEAVFYACDFVFDEPVHYFYRDDLISQRNREWFETKKYVGVIGAHTFRSEG